MKLSSREKEALRCKCPKRLPVPFWGHKQQFDDARGESIWGQSRRLTLCRLVPALPERRTYRSTALSDAMDHEATPYPSSFYRQAAAIQGHEELAGERYASRRLAVRGINTISEIQATLWTVFDHE